MRWRKECAKDGRSDISHLEGLGCRSRAAQKQRRRRDEAFCPNARCGSRAYRSGRTLTQECKTDRTQIACRTYASPGRLPTDREARRRYRRAGRPAHRRAFPCAGSAPWNTGQISRRPAKATRATAGHPTERIASFFAFRSPFQRHCRMKMNFCGHFSFLTRFYSGRGLPATDKRRTSVTFLDKTRQVWQFWP